VAEIDQSEVHSFAPSRGDREDLRQQPLARRLALRTAFVSRFILLREARRSKAHRIIESMEWDDSVTAEDLYDRFREAFVKNGDKLEAVDRDLRRALSHAYCSIEHFIGQYVSRSTDTFIGALEDYKKSNKLLFGDDADSEIKSVGWRLP
jgi:hypothetical protein